MNTILISHEPNADTLTITFTAAPVAQVQPQGTATVSFDAVGQVVAITIADASSVLWQNGGQVQVLLPGV
jgi:YD repeat-containing protein